MGGALKMKRIQLEVKIVMKGTERREDVLKMKRRIQSMRRRGKNKPWKVRKGYMRPGIRRRRKRKSVKESKIKSVGIRIRKTKRKSREKKKKKRKSPKKKKKKKKKKK